MRRLPSMLIGLLALAAALTGCGQTVVDAAKTEAAIRADLSRGTDFEVGSVSCPSGVPVEAGRTITCTVRTTDGRTGAYTLRIRDSEADLTCIRFVNVRSDTSSDGCGPRTSRP